MNPNAPDVGGPNIPGVIARPILLFPTALVVGAAVDHLLRLPLPVPGDSAAHWIVAAVGAILIVAGITIFIMAVRGSSKAQTPLPTNQPVRALVTTGIFNWSRNPVYLAFFLSYVGIGLLVRSSWILLLVVPLAMIIRFGVVAREEDYLKREFGDDYRQYRSRVRRWL
jgi:protein-S-isoprenylcysteine O-methyltransferase Ste14